MRVLVRQVRGRGRKPNWRNAAKEVERTIEAMVKPRVLAYFEKFVADWDHKVTFRARKQISRAALSLYVYPATNKDIWKYVSRGTRKHAIRPKKKGGVLAFPTGYAPHTTPRGPSYGGPGTASGPTVFAAEVAHPGTKGRHFEEAVGRWAKTWFGREIENAIRRGARK